MMLREVATQEGTAGVMIQPAGALKFADVAAVIASIATCLMLQTSAWPQPDAPVPFWLIDAVLAGVWCAAVFFAGAASESTIAEGSTGAVRAIAATIYSFGALAFVATVTGLDFARVPLVVAMPFGLGVMLLARLVVRGRVRRRPSSLQRARAFLDDVASPQGSTWPATTGDPHASARTPRRTR